MPRDSNGNYQLPAGNPVVSGEVISTSWANPTMSDLAVEMTNSLDRQGRGGMLAPFKFADGTVGAPSLTFNNEPTTGIYRFAAQDVRVSVAGLDKFRWNAAGAQVWDATIAPSGAWSNVANQNQIDTINTTLGNVAKLDAINKFTKPQVIQFPGAELALYKDAAPTKAARFGFNNAIVDGFDLSLFDGTTWNYKLLVDATGSVYRNIAHTFKSADGSTDYATLSNSGVEFNKSVYSKNTNPAYFWWNTSAPADQKVFLAQHTGAALDLSAWNDALTVNRNALTVNRSGVNITNITYGNQTNNPVHTFHGNAVIQNFSSDNILWMNASGSPANSRKWSLRNNSSTFSLAAWDDAESVQAYAWLVSRSGANISGISFYAGVSSLIMSMDTSGLAIQSGKTLYLGANAGFTDTDASNQKSPRVRDSGGFKGGLLYWNDSALLTGNITYGTGAAPATGTAGSIYLQIV